MPDEAGNEKAPALISNILVTLILPAIVFIAAAAVISSQVSDLKTTAKETATIVHSISERLVKVETKVQVLYDERNQGR